MRDVVDYRDKVKMWGCGTLLTIVTKLKWGLRLTLFIIKGGGEGLAGRLCIYAENRGQGADHKQ